MIFGYNTSPICGGRHESQLEGYTEEIKSKEIIYFSYTCVDFCLSAEQKSDKIKIVCSGGGKSNKRDGTLFRIVYETNNANIFKNLQEIIEENNEIKGNGHCVKVDGLPPGLGDTLNVSYSSGEKIYKMSNQHKTVSEKASKEFYQFFHELVKKEGYDFNTSGSNVTLFDDATTEYLQGTWKGKHFGDEIEVTFKDDKVTIKVDGKITDENIPYIIYNGFVKQNKLIEGKTKAESEDDYENFKAATSFSKKNWFTLTGHFYINASSNCDLFNFDKPKPIDEE